MTGSTDSVEQLQSAIRDQNLMMRGFLETEYAMKQAVKERDWSVLENLIQDLQLRSGEIAAQETRRQQLVEQLCEEQGLAPDAGIQAALPLLPQAEHDQLSALIAEMKLTVVELQGLSRGLENQVTFMQKSTEMLIGDIFPHRRGKLYSRQGHPRRSAGPMVVNRSF